MSEKITKKQSDTEFVCKLCDMINKYPKIINWNEEGDKMIISDIEQMESLILPQYFRHGNFPSFIRQLNMYDFHKLYKENKLIAFENQFFKKGNENNFHFIQRRKKIKEQELVSLEFERKNENILKRLKKEPKITPEIKNSIQSLLEFKYTAYENTKTIQEELKNLYNELKECRSKKISEALKEIKNTLVEQLDEQLEMAKEIDKFLEITFLQQKENNHIIANEQPHLQMNSQFYLPFLQEDKHFTKSFIEYHNMASNIHSLIALSSRYSYWSTNDIQCIQPVFYSGHKIMSKADFSTINQMKNEEFEEEEDDGFSMEKIPEDQLQEILQNDQKEKKNDHQFKINEENNVLKCEAE